MRLKYIKTWVHKPSGKVYARFVKKGMEQVQLPTPIGSAQFMAAYMAALDHGKPLIIEPGMIGASRLKPGSVASVVALFLQSSDFTADGAGTQRRRRPILERFREQHGDKPVAMMHRQFVEKSVQDLGGHRARNWIKAIRPLMRFALAQGFCESDPTAGIKAKVPKSDGHATWTEDHIALFRAHWKIGSMERLAMELALNTGQRVSDLIRMGRPHVRNGVIYVKQQKTGVEVEPPIHPDLAVALEASRDNLVFLTNAWGRPFTGTGFSEWFRKAARTAGIPQGYTAHGLRKACCKRLADMGVSVTDIAAISGHLTLKEIERYTKAYDRRKGAARAMAKLIAGEG